jgi:hypothetical protein
VPMTRRTLILHRLVPRGLLLAPRVPCSSPHDGENRDYRYWPVLATVSMERPASVPCLPETSVLM